MYYLIIVGCGIAGFFNGGRTIIGYCLMLDFSPKRYHSYLGSGWQIADGLILIWTTIYYQFISKNWVYIQLLGVTQGFFTMIIILFFVPESPTWLYEQKKFKECYEVFEKMAKINGKKMGTNALDYQMAK